MNNQKIEFKGSNTNLIIGIIMLVLGLAFMPVFLLLVIWGIREIMQGGELGTVIFLFLFCVGFTFIWAISVFCLFKSAYDSRKRVKHVVSKYGEAYLRAEIENHTIRKHVNHGGFRTVYFTGRMVIDPKNAAFYYGDIKKIWADWTKAKYTDRLYTLWFVLTNGEEIEMCSISGMDAARKQTMLEYIEICRAHNPNIEVDISKLPNYV